MVCLFILLFIIQDTILQKIVQYIVEIVLFIIMRFQISSENEFHGFGNLVIWLWKSFGKVLEIF